MVFVVEFNGLLFGPFEDGAKAGAWAAKELSIATWTIRPVKKEI